MKFSASRGFTLLEVIIAIAILAILAVIALPSYMRYVERGHLEAAHAELARINTQIKIARVKEPGALAKESDLEDKLAEIKEEIETGKKEGFEVYQRYTVSVAMPDEKSSVRYHLTAVPKESTGYTLALWMDSVGNVYRCTSAASANAYATGGGCERIGG